MTHERDFISSPNRRKRLGLWLVICTLGLLCTLHVSIVRVQADPAIPEQAVQQLPGAGHRPDTLLLGIVPGIPEDEVAAVLNRQGMTLVRSWPELNMVEARITPNATAALNAASIDAIELVGEALGNEPAIAFVELDHVVTAADLSAAGLAAPQLAGTISGPPLQEPMPSDPLLDQQWSIPRVQAVDSWNISQGNPDVTIAIIDSGYNVNHPDIDESVLWTNLAERDGLPNVDDDNNGYVDDIHGWDWVDDDNIPDDTYGHGTHVLGTIGAATNNDFGIAGLGRSLTVAPLRILDSAGSGYISDLVAALDYAALNGFAIANMSLTISKDFTSLGACRC